MAELGFEVGWSWRDWGLENLGEMHLWRRKSPGDCRPSRRVHCVWDSEAEAETVGQNREQLGKGYLDHGFQITIMDISAGLAIRLLWAIFLPYILRFFSSSKAICAYGRKWKNTDKQIEENYTTRHPATKPLLTIYKSFQVFMYVFFFD